MWFTIVPVSWVDPDNIYLCSHNKRRVVILLEETNYIMTQSCWLIVTEKAHFKSPQCNDVLVLYHMYLMLRVQVYQVSKDLKYTSSRRLWSSHSQRSGMFSSLILCWYCLIALWKNQTLIRTAYVLKCINF